MGFVKTLEEVADNTMETVEFYDAEALSVFFVTKPEIAGRLLPPPLKPSEIPIGYVFIANYPKTSFGVAYLESALFLLAEFNGEPGIYCLAMPVTNDIALILGREIFGYPKKIGNIHLNRRGEEMEGWTERHGVRILGIKVRLTGKFNDEAAQANMKGMLQPDRDVVVYNHKYFPAPEMKGFDYNPRLIREIVKLRRETLELGKAEITLKSSDHDPWGDVEIVHVLGAVYTKGHNTMLPGSVVAEVEQKEFAPYGLMKLDVLKDES